MGLDVKKNPQKNAVLELLALSHTSPYHYFSIECPSKLQQWRALLMKEEGIKGKSNYGMLSLLKNVKQKYGGAPSELANRGLGHRAKEWGGPLAFGKMPGRPLLLYKNKPKMSRWSRCLCIFCLEPDCVPS